MKNAHLRPNGINGHIFGNSDDDRNFGGDVDQPSSYEPIAIIGCGMRLPGNVSNSEALWELLDSKKEGRCEIPRDRYNIDAFYGPGKQGHICTRYGYESSPNPMRTHTKTFCRYFLTNTSLGEVDTSFWSMSQKETEEMDPQQRLALEVVYECLQNSGTTNFKNKKIGAYFGIFGEVSMSIDVL